MIGNAGWRRYKGGGRVDCRARMQQAVTRELKLALIVGVTLVLGIAVLISDHLATKRRPGTVMEVAVQPAMTPPPAVVPNVVLAPDAVETPTPVIRVAADDSAKPLPQDPVHLAIKTPGVSGRDETKETGAKEPERGPGRIGPKPLILTKQTSTDEPESVELTPATLRTHLVAEGDSAFRLAKLYLGDGGKWKMVVDANPKVIGPEGQMRVGTTVVIPAGEPAGQVIPPVREVAALPKKPEAPKSAKSEPKKNQTTVATNDRNASSKSRNIKPYTVRPGDTLSGIARRELGNPGRAGEIAELNRSTIKNPDSLPLGAEIRLPAG